MKDVYSKYIDLFTLTRADVYYINGYYLKASLLYRRALRKALLYNGDLKSVKYGITNIERQLYRSEEKIRKYNYQRCHWLNYITYWKFSLAGYYYAINKKRLYIY